MAGSIDPGALAGHIDRFQVVDVRYPNEWEAGHISGAVHIPLDYVYERTGELDRSRPVVTVCRSGSRSAQAAEELAGEGFDVQNLSGGIVAWVDRGLPIVADGGGPGRVADPEPPPDDRPVELQRLQNDFMNAIFAVRDHFGDREPSEEEVLAFLRSRDQQAPARDPGDGPAAPTTWGPHGGRRAGRWSPAGSSSSSGGPPRSGAPDRQTGRLGLNGWRWSGTCGPTAGRRPR